MHFKFNRQFYRTLSFWLGVLCLLAELSIWSFDNGASRALGVGTGAFLILISLGWDTK
ncbi:hypothetical protein ACUIJQ_11650 [Levilactobacillus hammesii]|uniref:Uncharacterized protein n=1 Tax=Levilactobacillus hammesii DSM 16381 TaxID=1423753 RepID=A0A0R1UK66_9LACO|nr:hypothetical protein [Levilactobacillus hammesii]KRL93729.1 hypothetical protein FD28_GL000914 [Levilactobacillus hammesii DSM 16381]